MKENVVENTEFTYNNYWKINNPGAVDNLADCLKDLDL